MSSVVYFKFKASLKNDSIPFDGSAISVKDLKSAIRTKCCLYSTDFDLKLEDTKGKAYVKDDELIPKFTSIVVRRVPKVNSDVQKKKVHAPEELSWREAQKSAIGSESNPLKHVNLADSDLPEEEKIKIMMERSSEAYSEKNFAVKAKPYGVPPATYVCHKCGLSGHWIHNCPGVRDKTGKMMDIKNVKRPTGIPQDFLLEVEAGTPGAYLGKSGRYMVPIKDAEAYALGKKDKRPFSAEENPPYVPSERTPPKQFICPLCNNMFRDAVLVSCCGTTYCNDCIMGHVFDAQVLGSHKCPNCAAVLNDHESSVFENALVRSMIRDWLANETIVPEPDPIQPHHDIFKIEDTEKTFVNNRRVLKPKQALPSCGMHSKTTDSAIENQGKNEIQDTIVKDSMEPKTESSPTPNDTPSENCVPNPPAPTVASPHDFENVNELAVADKVSPVVTPNTCADVVASSPCTTFVAVSRQPLLTVASGLSSTQFPCMSYTNSTPVVPTIIPSINSSANPLLNAIYNMRVGSIQAPVVAPPTVLPVPFQGSIVGGADWTANAALAASVTQATGIVDPLLQVNSSQTAYGLVSGQAIPSAIPTALSAPIQAIDGCKVLSKEEFYRLKVEMLNSARRRHRHRSRSRSPGSSHRHMLHPEVSSRRHRYGRDDWDRRDRYRSPVDYEVERSRRHHYENSDYYSSRRDKRLTESRFRPERSDVTPPDFDRYYSKDRRSLRSRHLKPISIVRSSSRERAVYFSPRAGSKSPFQHRAYREPHRYREPHGDAYQLPDKSLGRVSVSPHAVSVVPQYELSEPESTGSKGRVSRRETSVDLNDNENVSVRSGNSRCQHRPSSLVVDWPSPVNDEVNVQADGLKPDFEQDFANPSLPERSKDKKHKKHRHRHHSDKRKCKNGEFDTLDTDGHVWVASNATDNNQVQNVDDTSEELEKKRKKHKKHKHCDPERKKRKQERKEKKRRELIAAQSAPEVNLMV